MENQNSQNDPSVETITGKILSTGLKVEGWDYRARVLKNVLFGIILIILGFYVIYTGNLAIGGVLVLIAVLSFLGAWFYWWRSKSLVKGKFYVPNDQLNNK